MPITLEIQEQEIFIEETGKIIDIKPQIVKFEHSLVSISKWESKWHKPYLSDLKKHEKTEEELYDYVRCMIITQNVKPDIVYGLTQSQINELNEYIKDPMTATWFNDNKKSTNSKEIITSELIYYWMITSGIPVEFQKWHLNRLLTLIQVCNVKNTPGKKMTQKEIMTSNRELNKARRKALNSKG